jgi:plastocyanin
MHKLPILASGGAAIGAIALAAGAFLLSGAAAGAASPAVLVGSPANRFSPNVVNINVGDTVTFNWSSGPHIVDLEDVSPDLTIDSTHTTGTTNAFMTAGTYYYYCSIHSTADKATEAHVQANDSMVGKIVVSAAGTATATATTPAATATTPAATATTPAATASATVVAPKPPTTGTGTSDDSTWPLLLVATGIALVTVSVGGGWLAVRKR